MASIQVSQFTAEPSYFDASKPDPKRISKNVKELLYDYTDKDLNDFFKNKGLNIEKYSSILEKCNKIENSGFFSSIFKNNKDKIQNIKNAKNNIEKNMNILNSNVENFYMNNKKEYNFPHISIFLNDNEIEKYSDNIKAESISLKEKLNRDIKLINDLIDELDQLCGSSTTSSTGGKRTRRKNRRNRKSRKNRRNRKSRTSA